MCYNQGQWSSFSREKTVLKVSVIAGLTRNLVNAANNPGDCGFLNQVQDKLGRNDGHVCPAVKKQQGDYRFIVNGIYV